jgi:CheY-like chemotaxis protein
MKLIRDLLQTSGYRTIEAKDGEQGIRMAKAKKPSLILMDIMMPKVDGYEACRVITMDKATRKIPVIMLTSLDYSLNKQLGKSVGASEYITKPIDVKKLFDVIHQFLPD